MKTIPIGLRIRTWFAVLGGLALAACGGGGGSSGAAANGNSLTPASTQAAVSELTDAFAATLTGGQEVPQRPSSASGSGTVVIQASTRQMTATLTTTGIAGTDAHIHQAPAGLNGPIIFPLAETARGSGVWTARAVLTDAQVSAFRAGDFYFNVHSAAFANGEIRGQILPQIISLEFITGAAGRNRSTSTPSDTGTTGTGTGSTGAGMTTNAGLLF